MTSPLGQISPSQIYMLFTQFLFTTILGFRLSLLIEEAQFSAWLPLLIGSFGGYVITYLSCRLAMKRPTQFFGNYGKSIVGSWLHYPLIFFMIFSFLFSAAFGLRNLQDFIIEVYLPDTPEWAVTSLFAICVAYAVRSGVQTIFKCAQGIFFLSIIGSIVIPLFVVRDMNVEMSVALFNHFETRKIWKASYLVTALYGEMAFVLYLFPYFSHPERTMRSLAYATLTSIIIVLANMIPAILIFGPQLAGSLIYPELELIRFIRAGSFLENLDPVLIAVWLSSLFIKISLLLYLAVIVLTQTFSLKDHKPFSLSMTAIIVGLALFMDKSGTSFAKMRYSGLVNFIMIAELIPVIYLLVDWIRSAFSKT
ncbi:GerAB/ArcD/ProY family transporter [Brevibacillus sp. 179-C9.3 HS]|uniref:GerAB/ArcD/ProY family transporter n=1 Tax=unclassified Brevibacillus TaxID=2684853 RepID=UPI0039A19CEF